MGWARRAVELALVVALGAQPAEALAAFPGGNGRIAFSAGHQNGDFGSQEIFVIERDGTGRTKLTSSPPAAHAGEPEFSADGRRIVYASDADGDGLEVWVMNADGTGSRPLTDGPSNTYSIDPTFSPDGTKIAYTSNVAHPMNEDIYVMDADGTNPVRLTENAFSDHSPAFSPDGSQIAFASSPDGGPSDLYVMDADGTNRTQLTNTGEGMEDAPDFSPDGGKIVFSVGSLESSPDLFVIDLASREVTPLTETEVLQEEYPVFSPDGTKVLYTVACCAETNAVGLFTVDADDGGNREMVIDSAELGPLVDADWGVDTVWEGDLVVTECDDPFLAVVTEVTGNLTFDDADCDVALHLPNLVAVGGDLTVTTHGSDVALPMLTVVSGSFTIAADGGSSIDAVDLTVVGGSFTIGADGGSSIDVESLEEVGDDVTVSDSDQSTIDLGAIESVGGDITVARNDGSTIDLGTIESVGGDITVAHNDGSTIDLGHLVTVGSDISIVHALLDPGTGTAGALDIGSLSAVGCNAVVETTQPALDIGFLEDIGCDSAITMVAGDSVTAWTPAGSGELTMLGGKAQLKLTLAQGAFSQPVLFTVAREPDGPPEPGAASDGGPAMLDPVAGYRFSFAVPALNDDARLDLTIDLRQLDPVTRQAVLDGLADGSASLAVKGDLPGDRYRAFRTCRPGESPGTGSCVTVEPLDDAGEPAAPGTAPAHVRFGAVVAHFSTYAVALTQAPPAGPVVPPVDGGPAPPPAATLPPARFGPDTLVSVELGVRRIRPGRRIPVLVANRNPFSVAGRLSGQTLVRRAGSRRRVRLARRTFTVAAGSTARVRLRMPRAMRRSLARGRRARITLRAVLHDPAGGTRRAGAKATLSPRR